VQSLSIPNLYDFPSNDTDGTMIRVKSPRGSTRRVPIIRSSNAMQQSMAPSLAKLSEFTTLSDDAQSQHQQMDSVDMAFEEYIGTEYGIATDGATLSGESAANSADDTSYYHNDGDSDHEAGGAEDVDAVSVASETTDDFIQLMDMDEFDGKWQLALQRAYERGFNKGYAMGVRFLRGRAEQLLLSR